MGPRQRESVSALCRKSLLRAALLLWLTNCADGTWKTGLYKAYSAGPHLNREQAAASHSPVYQRNTRGSTDVHMLPELAQLLSNSGLRAVCASNLDPSLALRLPASLAPLARAVTRLPQKQNLRTCLPNMSSWDSAASEVLQGRGDESVLLLVLSGGPDGRREAGVSGFEGTLTSLQITHLQQENGSFRG
ncbi:hypothetical protein D4764_05G0005120 [Takifugu flavidus]|uniref:Uncharacterized protein n=1 Tax=Takifugu flavidus TaxID=433684 RepID=A0A5C6MZ34_9TELE|nr:hypothetical protein D4764_05G0005120 [Takifugu flavidus]